MTLTNLQIEVYANSYAKEFAEFKSYIPAKISYYITKNIKLLNELATDIENAKTEIVKHYGTLDNESNRYTVPNDKLDEAYKELNDLYGVSQDIDIKTFSIETLEGVEFTPAQMEAIIFMVED